MGVLTLGLQEGVDMAEDLRNNWMEASDDGMEVDGAWFTRDELINAQCFGEFFIGVFDVDCAEKIQHCIRATSALFECDNISEATEIATQLTSELLEAIKEVVEEFHRDHADYGSLFEWYEGSNDHGNAFSGLIGYVHRYSPHEQEARRQQQEARAVFTGEKGPWLNGSEWWYPLFSVRSLSNIFSFSFLPKEVTLR